MAEELVTIEVDGVPLQAPKGEMLIRVTDEAGIDIPRFCYHDKLSVAANCRMCLVEVEKAPKPLPACATPIADGMKVMTRSPKAVSAQKGSMEFLLINHPLDCPICDQGGECELQDLAMGYGAANSRFVEGKRAVADKDIGPLVRTDMTRCIHCTRCVRFGEEIAGMPELGATGRGEFMEIGTYVEKSMVSELSANIIDLCPVGALTHKPYRYTARAWEIEAHPLIAPHDAVGSNVFLHSIRGVAKRVVPRPNEAVNEIWIADRDRFSYEALRAPDRLLHPMIKQNGEWRECDWETALEVATSALRTAVDNGGADGIGMLAAPHSTLEELYLFQRLGRDLGTPNVDHRIQEWDFRDDAAMPAYPALGISLADLETVDSALLIGSNIRYEAPLISHRLRKASKNDARIMALNPARFTGTFPLSQQITVSPESLVSELTCLLAAVGNEEVAAQLPDDTRASVASVQAEQRHRDVVAALVKGEQSVVLLGRIAAAHPQAASLRQLGMALALATGSKTGFVGAAGNSAGAWLAGVLPHREPGVRTSGHMGMNVRQMLEQPRRAYLLMNVEPALDFWDGKLAQQALGAAEDVVCLTPFATDAMKQVATVLLPISTFPETAGTYVNGEGRWQTAKGAVPPAGEARPGWKVLRVMGNWLKLEGFDYLGADEILAEVRETIGSDVQVDCAPLLEAALAPLPDDNQREPDSLERLGERPIYACDMLVRRSPALQQTPLALFSPVKIHPSVGEKLSVLPGDEVEVHVGETSLTLPLDFDEALPEGVVWLPVGTPETAGLGPSYGSVTLSKVKS